MILFPTGSFPASDWGTKAVSPAPHGFSQIVYQFSSSSANNGSAFDGLGTTGGLISNPNPAPEFVPWDIATALVMIFSRYLPIVAPIAMAARPHCEKFSIRFRDFARRHGDISSSYWGPLIFQALPISACSTLQLAERVGPIPFGG